MESEAERRTHHSDRVAVDLTVELGYGEALQDGFCARSVNLSKGGISMRSSCLPDVGTRLRCRFAAGPAEVSVLATGEVVWTQLDDDRGGEFGLRFLQLAPEAELMIDELLSECGTLYPATEGAGVPPAPIVQLELDGIAEPIATRAAGDGQGRATFEQQLDLLSLGRGVFATAPGEQARRGAISGVELRMVGNVPMLAVTVAFENDAWAEQADPDRESDTEPDLQTPAFAAEPAPAERTLSEFGTESGAQIEPGAETEAASAAETETASETESESEWESGFEAASEFPEVGAVQGRQRAAALRLEPPDGDAFSPPPSPLAGALRGLLVASSQGRAWMARTGQGSMRWLVPHARSALATGRAAARRLAGRHLIPWLLVLRRTAGALLFRRRRRTTAGHAGKARASSAGRTVSLGVLGAGAVALAVYALAPSKPAGVELHRQVEPPPGAVSEPTRIETPVQPAAVPVPVPEPATVPGDSPFAVDVRDREAASNAAAPSESAAVEARARGSLVFGRAQAPDGKRYTLRMSAPVRELKGIPDKGGFTVVIPGALSLDRAGPIGANHGAVQRSMILNKGDRAELTIRFAEGKQPAYQVKAAGNALEIVIES